MAEPPPPPSPEAVDSGPRASPSTGPSPGDSYVQSFARGLSVIRSFGAAAPRQTLTEVAAATGLSRASARRILLTLVALGYVQAQGRQFRLTPQTLELGLAYLGSQPLWSLAGRPMLALAAELQQSCTVAVLDGREIVCLLNQPGRDTAAPRPGIGDRLPAADTAMGQVLLAALDPDERQRRLAAPPFVVYARHPAADPATLQRTIEDVARQGWALVERELEDGRGALAAPVNDGVQRTVAALGLSWQAGRLPAQHAVERCLPSLLRTAATLSSLISIRG